jgi:hypothetical protein
MSISILTCAKGDPESLRLTYRSIKPWLTDSFRWTIKFSQHSSPAFMAEFESPHVFLHHRSDSSLYDGLNQALDLVNSEYYFVMGAGDELSSDGIRSLFTKVPAAGFSGSSLFAPVYIHSINTVLKPNPAELNVRMATPHPGSILSVEKSRAINGFDVSYRVAADYDHLCRYVRKYGNGTVLDIPPLVLFAAGGLSELDAAEGMLEEELIRRRIMGSNDFSIYRRLFNRTAPVMMSVLNQLEWK